MSEQENKQNDGSTQEKIDKLNSLISDLQDTVEKMKEDIKESEKPEGSDEINTKEQESETAQSTEAETVEPKLVITKGDLQKADPDAEDYVMPRNIKNKRTGRRHHHHHSSHSSNSHRSNLTQEEIENMEKGFVYHTSGKHRKNRKKRKVLKIIGIIFAILFGIIIVALSTVLILNQVGKNQMHDYNDIDITVPENLVNDLFVENNGKTIKYDGKTYSFNEDVSTIAFLGIDRDEFINEGGNMADAIYIAVIDEKASKVRLICVSRETMADVDVYSDKGTFVDTQKLQICLAYAYGDGKETSCENVTRSLSRLFYGIPFKTYFAIDFNALKTLNDTVGGVTVKSLIPFKSKVTGQQVNVGDEVTLYGEDALVYVRQRDTKKLESNNDRIARQEQYIDAFLSSVIPAAKENISVVSDLYNTIAANSTTSLTLPKITYLASSALSNISGASDIEFINIPGEIVAGEKFAEFHADDKELIKIMLDVFYEEVK
ncbi:MAG: LCP family protein [Oscillospiraceae bacterium]|nr:LCP family protein [Candidatus Ruminococcus equi]